MSPELFAKHDHLHHAEPQALFSLRQLHTQPALLGHRLPQLPVETVLQPGHVILASDARTDEGTQLFRR